MWPLNRQNLYRIREWVVSISVSVSHKSLCTSDNIQNIVIKTLKLPASTTYARYFASIYDFAGLEF